MTEPYDLVVIGGGSGGVRAARVAAKLGARVALCEKKSLGGTCVNVGCVPKKLFVYASQYRDLFSQAAGFGWHAESVRFDWARLRDNTQTEIQRLNDIYQQILEQAGVDIINGHATITPDGQVQIGQQQLKASHIIIATGGTPFMPEIAGIEHAVNSDQVFELEQFPEKIVIVGGGYIATEFAGIFHGLGSQVSMINRGEAILQGFDRQMTRFVEDEMQKHGIEIINDNEVTAIEPDEKTLRCHLKSGEIVAADTVLVAAGRLPQSKSLFDPAMHIDRDDAGHIKVNDHYQTSQAHIYAIGDVTGGTQLTPVAIAQGQWLAEYLFREYAGKPAIKLIPTTVFGHSPLASVGLSEEQAQNLHPEVVCFTTTFKPMRQSLGGGNSKIMMKVVSEKQSDRVLGIHIAGDDAAEILQGFAAAMRAGLTKRQLDQTIGIHPTSAEELITLN